MFFSAKLEQAKIDNDDDIEEGGILKALEFEEKQEEMMKEMEKKMETVMNTEKIADRK